MRVYVEHDMTVCHVSQVIELKAGTVVDSPLADYLVESDCDVTIEQDDSPAPAPVAVPASIETVTPPAEESHTPGSGEQDEAPESAAEPGPAE
jgi:hypothetical protein